MSSIIRLRPSTIPRLNSIPSIVSFRSFHYLSGRNDEINTRAINVYHDLISVYTDQKMTASLKQRIVKGMFLTNDIKDMSNPVFRRLNGIIRQDPNLMDAEKLDLISSLNTNHTLFEEEYNTYNIDEELSIRDVMKNENFLKKTITAAGVIGLSLFSIITLASIV